MWRAEAGKGATRNGRPIAHSGRTTFTGARTPTDALPKVDADLVAVAKPNSIALRIAMVAAGEADLLATIRWGHEWDIAAAVLIAREAGCEVTDALGRETAVQHAARGGVRGAGGRARDPARGAGAAARSRGGGVGEAAVDARSIMETVDMSARPQREALESRCEMLESARSSQSLGTVSTEDKDRRN